MKVNMGRGIRRSALAVLCAFFALGVAVTYGGAAVAGESNQQQVAHTPGAAQSEVEPDGQQVHATTGTKETKGNAVEARVVPPIGPSTPLPEGDADINQLLRLWGVFGDKIDTSCGGLRVGDLRCLSEQGTITTLERFNRPAILLLKHDGQRQRVLLTQLDKTHATLAGATGVRRVSLERLAQLWAGVFEVVWRADAGAVLIYPGMRSSAVVWLRQRLAMAASEHPDEKQQPGSRYFDYELESKVRNFQLLHGLEPDGLVGPRTQIILNGIAPEPGVPTLSVTTTD